MIEFGEQLRRAREEKGMTQQTLAEQLYVTRQSVSRWECGDRYPDLITTKKISQILDVSLDDLLSANEMEKVVERNPIIENKAINAAVIVMYAFLLFSCLVTFSSRIIIAFMSELSDVSFSPDRILQIAIWMFIPAVMTFTFGYGLVNSARGLLSPKKTGIIILISFVYVIIERTQQIYTPKDILLHSSVIFLINNIIFYLPCAAGAAASYLYFIKGKKNLLWALIITAASMLNFYVSVMIGAGSIRFLSDNVTPITGDDYSTNETLNMITGCTLCAIIIYQTWALYKKRKTAAQPQNA